MKTQHTRIGAQVRKTQSFVEDNSPVHVAIVVDRRGGSSEAVGAGSRVIICSGQGRDLSSFLSLIRSLWLGLYDRRSK